MESRLIVVKDNKGRGASSINKIVTVLVKYCVEEELEEETFKLVVSNKPNIFGAPKEVSISSLMGQHCLYKKATEIGSYIVNNVSISFIVLRVETENQYENRIKKQAKLLMKK